MHARGVILLAASLSAAVAFPSPSLPLGKRDWTNDEKGNVKITFSDDLVNIGTAPVDALIGNLTSACNDSGQCSTHGITIDGYLRVYAGFNGEVDQETITLTPSGSYPTWIHNGLLDALGAAVKAAANCTKVTNEHTCVGYMTAACGDTSSTVEECTVPSYWGINYQAKDAATSAPPFVGTSVDVTIKDAGDNFCSTFTQIGGAVAGAVNGVAGGMFTLLGMACQDKS